MNYKLLMLLYPRIHIGIRDYHLVDLFKTTFRSMNLVMA